jgi:nitrite reductase/ring-hydroxylating ferredoxin subunit
MADEIEAAAGARVDDGVSPPPGFVSIPMAAAAEISHSKHGVGVRVSVAAEKDVAVFSTACGRLFAIDADCPHQGAPLEEGVLDSNGSSPCVSCPRHGWWFDLTSGFCEDIEDYGLRAYDVVRLDDGQICVSLSSRPQPAV